MRERRRVVKNRFELERLPGFELRAECKTGAGPT
jgi:hypothetical protein